MRVPSDGGDARRRETPPRASRASAEREAAAFVGARPIDGPEGIGLYRLLVESVEDYAIFALDVDGIVISWNAGAERLKGYTPEEIIGQHFSVFYPADDVAAGKPARSLAIAIRDGSVEKGGPVAIRCDASYESVELSVADNGPGIAPEQHLAIFQPFVQIDRSLTSGHEGTGLGLAISRVLARAMGGDVTIDSVPGEGATFTLTLPAAPKT